MKSLVSLEEARGIARSLVNPMPHEKCGVRDALGRVLSSPAYANLSLPRFCNAGMDGIAVFSDGPSLEPGTRISVRGEHLPGDPPDASFACVTAVSTGAELPTSAYAVIPIEHLDDLARDSSGRIVEATIRETPRFGANIRRVGDDLAKGDRILVEGTRVRAEDRMVLMGAGVEHVSVCKRPAVAIIATGRELRGDGDPVDSPHLIENVTSAYLEHLVTESGGNMMWSRQCRDDAKDFGALLRSALTEGADLIITTGAVSAGRADFIPDFVSEEGGTIHFRRMRVRPGMPTMASTLSDGTPLISLPGNPMSTALGFRLIVQPMMAAMLGTAEECPTVASLEVEISKSHDWTSVLKAFLRNDEHGHLIVRPLSGQESFRVSPLIKTNCWLILDRNQSTHPKGSHVSVLPLIPGAFPSQGQRGIL